MFVTARIEHDLVFNAIEEGDTLKDIYEYVSNHVDSWGRRIIIWNTWSLNFDSIDSESIQSFVQQGTQFPKKRTGLKTAMFDNSDHAYRMMRMFQIIAEGRMKIVYGAFICKSWINTLGLSYYRTSCRA